MRRPVVGAIVLVTCAAIDKAIWLVLETNFVAFLSLSLECRWTNQVRKGVTRYRYGSNLMIFSNRISNEY